MLVIASSCAVEMKNRHSLRFTMDKTVMILAIPGLIVALPVLFDAVFGKV
jgi:hypothetical protein